MRVQLADLHVHLLLNLHGTHVTGIYVGLGKLAVLKTFHLIHHVLVNFVVKLNIALLTVGVK